MDRPPPLLRRAALVALSALVALGASVALPPGGGARPALPVAEAAGLAGTKPNIVVVLTDDQTIESATKMPYLQQGWRDGRYVRFVNGEVNNAICCPSRAALLTGQVDTRNGVLNNTTGRSQLKRAATVGVTLQRAGYRTALIGKLINGYTPAWGGFPGWSVFEPLVKGTYKQYDYTMLQGGREVAYGRAPADYNVDVLTRRAESFIRSTPANQPLFLYLAPTATHTPWTPAPRHAGKYADTPMPGNASLNEADVSDKPRWVRSLTPVDMSEQNRQRRKQWVAALGVDDMLRDVDRTLEATGRARRTVVVFVSDNGLAFGEHRWFSKRCAYRVCSEMLTYVKYPGVAGRTDRRVISNVDFAATFAALAGTQMSIKQDGVNLVPVLEDPTGTVRPRTGALLHWPGGGDNSFDSGGAQTPGFYGIRTERYRYVELVTGEKELYDLATDPHELTNLAGRSSYAATQVSLQRQLQRLKAASLS